MFRPTYQFATIFRPIPFSNSKSSKNHHISKMMWIFQYFLYKQDYFLSAFGNFLIFSKRVKLIALRTIIFICCWKMILMNEYVVEKCWHVKSMGFFFKKKEFVIFSSVY